MKQLSFSPGHYESSTCDYQHNAEGWGNFLTMLGSDRDMGIT
ncbi:MAG: hypothetical protein ABSF15_14120 [Candidatus Sulfotelmatobacter sp.]